MDYYCLGCNPEEDIQHLYTERENGYTYIRWGGCGHEFFLEGRTDEDIEKQRTEQMKRKRRNEYLF